MLQSTLLSTSSLVQVGTPPQYIDQWRSITSKRLMLNIITGPHLQFRSHTLLFHSFKWFNIDTAKFHHPVMQKEVNGLLSRDAIELSADGAGFQEYAFAVSRHTGGL